MKSLGNIKNIFWDFDGVIMDSMPVRDNGFRIVLKEFPEDQVNLLMDFHKMNGGLSRYVKFRHFFENILETEVSESKIQSLAAEFSKVMKEELVSHDLLIDDTLNFIKSNYHNYEMHIVSGSDGKELRYLCDQLGISKYFKSINGSPTPKIKLVSNLLDRYRYLKNEIVLIGDSVNDYEAAKENGIDFIGYNNPKLKMFGEFYINRFAVL